MILGFAHPALVVDDLEGAIQFYSKMFGFREISREGWENNADIDKAIGLSGSSARGAMLAGHNCFLEIWQYDAPAPSQNYRPHDVDASVLGIRHIAFYVDDLKSEKSRFLDLGGQLLGDAEEAVVYLRDPFGNIIELAEIPCAAEHPAALPGISHAADGSTTWRGEKDV